ncbi:hypothetical protein EVAR_23793_1 [Eumeta japonica]|uniref:Uncharacterized protein n=1 Tax=Eumeta variegata TaxID=151549 RepID=A0A4C1VLZ0_EUMVA|nr:hypothetical protein EVAR_23793_1 [Eumeta japonica]
MCRLWTRYNVDTETGKNLKMQSQGYMVDAFTAARRALHAAPGHVTNGLCNVLFLKNCLRIALDVDNDVKVADGVIELVSDFHM